METTLTSPPTCIKQAPLNTSLFIYLFIHLLYSSSQVNISISILFQMKPRFIPTWRILFGSQTISNYDFQPC